MEKGFIGNYVDAFFKQYLNFSGKATRSQFWLAILANIIVSCILSIIDYFCFAKSFAYDDPFFMMMPLSYIYSLLILIPSLALCVRRLHDVAKSGGMLLIAFIPLIGAIWLLVLFCMSSRQRCIIVKKIERDDLPEGQRCIIVKAIDGDDIPEPEGQRCIIVKD